MTENQTETTKESVVNAPRFSIEATEVSLRRFSTDEGETTHYSLNAKDAIGVTIAVRIPRALAEEMLAKHVDVLYQSRIDGFGAALKEAEQQLLASSEALGEAVKEFPKTVIEHFEIRRTRGPSKPKEETSNEASAEGEAPAEEKPKKSKKKREEKAIEQ